MIQLTLIDAEKNTLARVRWTMTSNPTTIVTSDFPNRPRRIVAGAGNWEFADNVLCPEDVRNALAAGWTSYDRLAEVNHMAPGMSPSATARWSLWPRQDSLNPLLLRLTTTSHCVGSSQVLVRAPQQLDFEARKRACPAVPFLAK